MHNKSGLPWVGSPPSTSKIARGGESREMEFSQTQHIIDGKNDASK